MGLDMYLYAKRFLGYDEKEMKAAVAAAVKSPFTSGRSEASEVRVEVMYWRNANAIHKWFVDNVQDGVDECQKSYVSKEDLINLRDVCQKVIDTAVVEAGKVSNGYTIKGGKREDFWEDGEIVQNPEEIEAILPSQGGFFFGGTDYDQYYLQGVEDTLEALNSILSLSEEELRFWDFEYHSSW